MSAPGADDNPYAAPDAEFARHRDPESAGPLEISGKDLIVPIGAVLPPLCVKTGRPIPGPPIIRNVFWTPLWIIFLIALYWPVGLLVFLFAHRKGKIAYRLAPEVRRRARIATIINALLITTSAAACALVIATANYWLAPLAVAPLIPAAYIYVNNIQTIHAARIERGHIRLRGMTPEVLDAMMAASAGPLPGRAGSPLD